MLFNDRHLYYPEWDWKPGPENQLWTQPTPGDDGSSELELHWLLYALVSIVKPRIAFESGCCHGFASYWMAKAIHDNGTGEFITCDVNRQYTRETYDRLLEFRGRYTVYGKEAKSVPVLPQADFFFCDSNYGDRAEELALLKPGAIALIHDTNEYARQWSNGAPDLRDAVDKFTEKIYFQATLRGFALVRKT